MADIPTWENTTPTWDNTQAVAEAPTWESTTPTWDNTQEVVSATPQPDTKPDIVGAAKALAAPLTVPLHLADGTPPEAVKTVEAIGQVYPALEVGAQMFTGMVADIGKNVVNALDLPFRLFDIATGNTEATQKREKFSPSKLADALTYKPGTVEAGLEHFLGVENRGLGEHLASAAAVPFETVTQLGDAAAKKTYETTGSLALAAASNAAVQGAFYLAPLAPHVRETLRAKVKTGELTKADLVAAGVPEDAAANYLNAAAEVSNRAKVEASTVDTLHGIKTDAENKAITSARRADVRAAFEGTPEFEGDMVGREQADYLNRVANGKIQERNAERKKAQDVFDALDAQVRAEKERGFNAIENADAGVVTPGEMGQDQPSRVPVQSPLAPATAERGWAKPTVDTLLADELAARQDAQLERLRAQQAASRQEAEAKSLAEAKAAEAMTAQAEILKRNPDTARNQWGDLKGGKWGNAAYDRLYNVSPRLALALDKARVQMRARTTEHVNQIEKFFGSDEWKSVPKRERISIERDMMNGDHQVLYEKLDKVPGLKQLYVDNVRSLIDEIGKARRDAGAEGFVYSYFPRLVRNVRALRRSLGREHVGRLDDAVQSAIREKGRPLNEFELSAIYNQALSGRVLKIGRERRVGEIAPEDMRFYEGARNTLISYLHRFNEDAALKEFQRNTLGVDMPIGKSPTHESIGNALARAQEAGGLRSKDIAEIQDVLSAILGPGRQAPGAASRVAHELTTGVTLGFNPLSTLQQIGDFAQIAHRFGVRETLVSLFGKRIANSYDIGIRDLAHEVKDARGLASYIRTSLQSTGFDRLDRLGSDTAVNASLRRNFADVHRDPKGTMRRMEKLFGNEAPLVVRDLANRVVSDRVKALVMHEVGGIRPVSPEHMPLAYVKHPNGRVMYSLTSWTLRQINFMRNTHIQEIRKGNVRKGVKGLVGLTLLMGLANFPVNVIRDIVSGRPVDPGKEFLTGMLGLGMGAKYMLNALDRGNGLEAWGSWVPIAGIAGGITQGLYDGVTKGDPVAVIKSTPTGRTLYNLFGNGSVDTLAGIIGAVITPSATKVKPDGPLDMEDIKHPPVERIINSDPVDMTRTFLMKVENDAFVGQQSDGTWIPYTVKGEGADKINGKDVVTPTLAWGHKITVPEYKSGKVRIGNKLVSWRDPMSDTDARALLDQDTQKARDAVHRLVRIPLSPNEYAALVSLVYNVGEAAFGKSRSLEMLNKGDREGFVKGAFDADHGFVHSGGSVNAGLVERRRKEMKLFLGGQV